jgi:AAA15 family ATPase/GTPase
MELVGIEISNFRSIGEEPVVIYPMQKCNILIGKNNVGKSNVIRAFQWIIDYLKYEKLIMQPTKLNTLVKLLSISQLMI